jgi:hypothetical protein
VCQNYKKIFHCCQWGQKSWDLNPY